MRHFPKRALVLIALSAPLGACSSFLGIHFAHRTPQAWPAVTPVGALAANAESGISAGRQQLAAGQIGLAIEAFQRAMASGEPIAPAVNGLGVAYARLGRFDLAQRYFQQAMASDPANTKYADNLAKLMRSPTLAMRHDGDIAGAALKAAIPFRAGDMPAQAVRDASAVGKLQRVSRGEVRIASAPPLPAPAATAQAKVDVRLHPPVRVSLAEPTAMRAISSAQVVPPESTLATTEPDPVASSTDQAAIRH